MPWEESDSDASEESENEELNSCLWLPINKRLRGILIQLGLSLIVLGCMAGALIWSFNNGEKGTDNGHHETKRDASVNFTIFIDEWAAEGTYTVTRKSVDGPNNVEKIEEYESFWYQDDKKKQIVHRVDESHTIYVRADSSFYVEQEEIGGKIHSCEYLKDLGYDLYIERTGLDNPIRHYSSIERTKNHAKVYIYEGDPDKVSLLSYGDAQAFLVTAYADAGNGALLGWETYFESDGTNDYLYMASYWYDQMSPSTPSEKKFVIPGECEVALEMHHGKKKKTSKRRLRPKGRKVLRTNRVYTRG